MLIIFDVDGTLIESDPVDWTAFKGALQSVLGFTPPSGFCRALGDVTAHSVAAASMRAVGREVNEQLMDRVREENLRRLQVAYAMDRNAFPARLGAAALLKRLRATPGVTVAIATGCWQPTIRLKLEAAGIDVAGLPMATCSDRPRRSEIITLAAERAGRPVSEAVYVGDGQWDLFACRELGIPLIATGKRWADLQQAGAKHLQPELDQDTFLDCAQAAGATLVAASGLDVL